MISQTTFQPIQVIIISLTYYSSNIVLCSFNYHICFVYCWPVCLHLLDQCSLVLKLFLGRIKILYAGRIKTWHTDLLPVGLWKVVARVPFGWSYLFPSIDYFAWSILFSSYLFQPYYFYCWILCIIFIGSAFIDNETCPRVC